jgi:esterase/lipase superfamily enzyme
MGRPVLVFPTAGGDANEIDRHGLIGALWPLIDEGRLKVYSIDSIAGRSWLRDDDPRHSMWLQNQYDAMLYHEVVPAIRSDCESNDVELVTAGASIGAFNAVAALCRHPDVFRLAIGMSGTYDLSTRLDGHWSDDFYFSSPLHFLPGLAGPHLEALRRRFVVLATGQGRWEDPGETWKMAHALGEAGVPNRVDLWSEGHEHDWPTWREMLPLYLDDLAD